jgi:hypothetical protein
MTAIAMISRAASTRSNAFDKWPQKSVCKERLIASEPSMRARNPLMMVPNAKSGMLRVMTDVVSCAL